MHATLIVTVLATAAAFFGLTQQSFFAESLQRWTLQELVHTSLYVGITIVAFVFSIRLGSSLSWFGLAVLTWTTYLVGLGAVVTVCYVAALEGAAIDYPVVLRYNMNHHELQDWLKRAKIYWHATGYGELRDANPGRAEHFGLSTIDAAQAGAVPVVFEAGGQPEIINHGKNGFLWRTTGELIQFTGKLMHDEFLWKDLSTNARRSMTVFGRETQRRWFQMFLDSYIDFDTQT
jgi:glycosyltransferase involved in cell wall biosynthesis